MMQPLPSPAPGTRYHEIRFDDVAGDEKHSTAFLDPSDPFYKAVDEERAWSDITAGDPDIPHRRLSRRRRMWKAFMSVRSLVDTALLVVILVLVLDRGRAKSAGPVDVDVGGDITGFAPTFPKQIQQFSPDPTFFPENGEDFFTDEVQERWLSIVPRGLGYVRVDTNTTARRYDNLPTPLSHYPPSTFTTSLTHQLHCLHTLAGVAAAFTAGRPELLHRGDEEEGREADDAAWHLGHCVDYLRQSIMCSGDVALEGQHTTFPERVTGSDGWDGKHVCRDYRAVMKHLEERRVDDERWI
ncbi:hypothetical protein VTJ83DRAFT_4662 [Remersonia thermophila]|uniref:Oxidase ustYa n=1 Tax=Remersonia thermophila TaxID=72144 RepID=A0ABR4DAK4_9PEZI